MTKDDHAKSAIEKVASLLIELGVASDRALRGCTPAEIKQVEDDIGLTIPSAYRAFLARMGREAGRLYLGTDVLYPAILGMTQAAHDLVAEDKHGIELPRDAIAFAMHQGYQFLFIRATEGDDPPVYYFMEQSGVFENKADRLSEFLLKVARDDW